MKKYVVALVMLVGFGPILSGCAEIATAGGSMAVTNYLTKKPEPPTPVDPVYCYSTIAGADCYVEPQPDQKHRLIGMDGTNPFDVVQREEPKSLLERLIPEEFYPDWFFEELEGINRFDDEEDEPQAY